MLSANGEHHTLYVGRKDDPLFKTRRLMTRGWERLSDHQRDKLLRALDQGDPDGECGAGILGKELLREMYAAKNLHAARWKLVAFYQHAVEADDPELTRLTKTVSTWEEEILNYHVTGISNGPTEAQNLIAEKLRRIGHGMRNFENYRLRLLLHSGVTWNTRSTARIRGLTHASSRKACNCLPRSTISPQRKFQRVV
jgi:transposase